MTSDRADRLLRAGLGASGILAFALLWQAFAMSGLVDIRFSSSPTRIASAAAEMLRTRDFWVNAQSSVLKFAWGMLLASLVGIPLGLMMGWFRRLRLALEPVAMVFYSVPSTTFMPPIILQLGIGINAYAAIVFMGAVFPILLNSMAGVRQVQESLVKAARSFGATNLELFRFVLLPSALPFVMAGVRLGLGRALMAVILAEMYFSIAGVGHLIMRYQAGLNTDYLMVLVVAAALFGVALISLARRLEFRLGPWRHSREAD